MNQARFLVPEPVGKLLGLLPAYPGSFLFATGLNLTVKSNLPQDVLQHLSGKKLRIRVIDANIAFDFEWRGSRFCACAPQKSPDLIISASAQDFLLLAQRKEDPDTLFFSRRLMTEGDTELGLLVKNTLDAIELPVFDQLERLSPARVLGRIRAGAQRDG